MYNYKTKMRKIPIETKVEINRTLTYIFQSDYTKYTKYRSN